MPADTTSRSAPATRSQGCRQSPSLTLRCLPTALFRNGNTPAPGGGSTARQADAAVARALIMAAQRPSFPACPWSLCPTLPKEAVMRPLSGQSLLYGARFGLYPGEIDKLWQLTGGVAQGEVIVLAGPAQVDRPAS